MIKMLSAMTLASSILSADSYTEIQDTANLPFLSSEMQGRETAKITLENGMQILLVSDPNADQAAAVVAVHTGSWSDPTEYPGMAHFCEHMLFMGTEKYPDSNEFSSIISNFNGLTNAFTAPDKTVYMFSCNENGFLHLIDSFAHFFIDPIFDPSNIAQEMQAVDQEFSLMKENDGWREYMVLKETGSPTHPNRLFSAGNSKTLSSIPQSALKKWHRENYGAERMKAAIYSSMPISSLKDLAAQSFANVPKALSPPQDFSAPITTEAQKNKIIAIESIKNIQTINLAWELPPHLSDDETKSADLVAYALKRGGPHSLYQKLKNEQLAHDILIEVGTQAGNGHRFFEVALALSDKGKQNINEVVTLVFQAIKGLTISQALFDEKNQLAKLKYQYQSRIDAYQFVSQIGRSILDEDLASFPRKLLVGSEFDPQKVQEAISFLTPSKCIITHLANHKTSLEKKEKWLSVPYSIQTVPSEWASAWDNAKPNPDIKTADLNPFVPKNLHSIPDPNLGASPICIANSPLGTAYYARCPEYQSPDATVYLHILSPQINGSAKSYCLNSLYLDHLTDELHYILLNANSAGLYSDLRVEKNKIHLTLRGFSEKIPELLQEIITQMPLKTPTEEQFNHYVSRHRKAYENSSKNIPVRQAKELLSSLISQDKTTSLDNLAALNMITYEEFIAFHKKLFEKTYFEALFAGNLSLKTAESSWLDILHALGRAPYPKSEHPQAKALHLSDTSPVLIQKETDALGNAAILLIDEGDFSPEKKSVQKILSAAIKEPFFDTLRTKQKTAYIAQSSDTEFEKRLYQYFLVQSSSHQGEDLLYRFELFLEDFKENLATHVPSSRFDTLKASAIDTLKTQCRNITDKSALWDYLAFEEKGDFTLVARKIEALEKITYEQFKTLSSEFISRENRKRLAILYNGKVETPFAYVPMEASDLSQVAKYEPRPETTQTIDR